jgi:hypothetical protein
MGKHFIDPKSSEIGKFFKVFLGRRKLPFFGQNCSLPFSSRSLDIAALLKSWQKHYVQPRFRINKKMHVTQIYCTCDVLMHTKISSCGVLFKHVNLKDDCVLG